MQKIHHNDATYPLQHISKGKAAFKTFHSAEDVDLLRLLWRFWISLWQRSEAWMNKLMNQSIRPFVPPYDKGMLVEALFLGIFTTSLLQIIICLMNYELKPSSRWVCRLLWCIFFRYPFFVSSTTLYYTTLLAAWVVRAIHNISNNAKYKSPHSHSSFIASSTLSLSSCHCIAFIPSRSLHPRNLHWSPLPTA